MAYTIIEGTPAARSAVAGSLAGLERVSEAVRDKIVTAWLTTLNSSVYARLEDVPWDVSCPDYRLIDHVNEVTRIGFDLAQTASREWGRTADLDTLMSILILHDVDKPLMFTGQGEETRYSPLLTEIPHGVVGAMLLKELGFPHPVVSTVTLHSPRMPYPGRTYEAYVLFYADMFACDNTMLKAGQKPFYFGLELDE
jgi:putative nucleotidyltransferase with HDIG domain